MVEQRNALKVTTPNDTDIVMTRTFNAPRDLVFKAHTSAEHMRHWWGLRGSEMVTGEVDFRPGGAWRIVIKEENGVESPFKGEFREIVPPERITWTFIYDVEPYNVHAAVETMEFSEQDGKTTITVRSVYPSKEVRDAVIGSGMEYGAGQTYDRLEEYLVTLASA